MGLVLATIAGGQSPAAPGPKTGHQSPPGCTGSSCWRRPWQGRPKRPGACYFATLQPGWLHSSSQSSAAGPGTCCHKGWDSAPEGSLPEAGIKSEVNPKPRSLRDKLKSVIKTDLDRPAKQQAGAETWGKGAGLYRSCVSSPLKFYSSANFQPMTDGHLSFSRASPDSGARARLEQGQRAK